MSEIKISDRAEEASALEEVAAKIAQSAARLPQIEDGTPEQARAFRAERGNPFAPDPCDLHEINDIQIPISRGSVSARCYVPSTQSIGGGCLVFFHGGGYVLSTVDDYDTFTQRIAMHSNCMVISIDYELAPDNKIKSIHQDGFDAYRWIVENASELDIDPKRVAVGGDSAGGNLTVAITHACKKHSYAMPKLQVLLYPSVDPTMNSPSVEKFAHALFLTKRGMTWFRSHYLESSDQINDPDLNFLQHDLSELPEAFLITAGFDPLRDEAQAYCDRLREFGVEVEHICYTDQIHAFISFAGGIAAGEDALQRIGAKLKQDL